MSYQRQLREENGRLADRMEAIVNKAKATNRGLTSAEREQFHKMETDFTANEDSIKIADRAGKLSEFDSSGISESGLEEFRTGKSSKPKDATHRAFSNYLRGGLEALDSDERQVMSKRFMANPPASIQNAQSTTTGSQGGYIVPQGFSDELEAAKKWFGGIEGTVGKFKTGSGNLLPWPTTNDTTNRGEIIGQNTQVSEQDIVFGQVNFNAYIGSSKLVLVPLALLQDSYFDMDALVARMLGERLGRLQNWKCTVGTGTNEPTGIVTATVAAGNVLTAPTGETTSITYNDLVNLEHSVDPAYREMPSTCFMFSDAVLKVLKKLVDSTNRPLWQPGLTASFREGAGVTQNKPTILGYPYVINQDMAVPAADAYTMLFGDMSKFKFREVAGGTSLLRLVERYADYLQVGFLAWQRWDSNLLDAGAHPLAVFQQSHT